MPDYTRRILIDLLDRARAGAGPPDVHSRLLGPAEQVALPPLAIGQHMLRDATVTESPPGARWDDASFTSTQRWECAYRDALVYGPAGITCLGAEVVGETLMQTDPRLTGYERTETGISIAHGASASLGGTWLSLLGGNHRNYYHWMLEGLGRLAGADPAMLATTRQVLVPEPVAEFHAASLAYSGILEGRAVREVGATESMRVERMVVPWSVSGFHQPHPCLRPFFARLRDAAPQRDEAWPSFLYIDRRGSDQRRLVNEAAVVEALARRGFTSVRLERHPLADQIALFAHARMIVAPHGAGLTNLLFAQPGCRVVELLMDGYMNWCFRRLAAVAGIAYDCVLGRQRDAHPWVHARGWEISPLHVLAAVDRHLAQG